LKDFLAEIKEKVLIFDGSKGAVLQQHGLKGGECPELWNVTHPEEVKSIYKSYKEAGSDVIQTNTFQGNRETLDKYSLGDRTYELNYESVNLAKSVMGEDGFVAVSIGPIGKLFEPSGELTFEKAYKVFKEQIKAAQDANADIINFETFTDLAEMRAALIAAKELSNLPVICSVAFESNGKTLMGTDPYTVAVVLKSLGADMVGTNCSFGPEQQLDIIKQMSKVGGVYLFAKPNAGLPEMVEGKAMYKESPEKFAKLASEFVKYGVRLFGGCCGTTPEFIKSIKKGIEGIKPVILEDKNEQVITSGFKTLDITKAQDICIGRLDAGQDEELFSELSNNNLDFVMDKALELAADGYDAIFINVDKVGKDIDLLADVVNMAQGYIKEPFILKTKNSVALEQALRLYKGKAGVIIDSFSDETKAHLSEALKKYGSAIISEELYGIISNES
jgi:5-methyltetrahydrofolate--homocysteine methyltransferase